MKGLDATPPGGNKEAVWSTWFKKFNGIWRTDEDMMPEAARKPWGEYCHFSGSIKLEKNFDPSYETDEDDKQAKIDAAKAFKAATGFDAEEVYQLMHSLK